MANPQQLLVQPRVNGDHRGAFAVDAIAHAQAHGFSGLSLVNGTEPFSGIL